MAARRVAALAGTVLALWLFLPATPAHACGEVTYADEPGPAGPPQVSDPCAPQAQTGAAAMAAAGLAAAAAAAAVSAARGAVPSPEELTDALPSPTGQAAEGNASCRTGGDPVDVVSGQMITSETDVELPGLLPLVLRRAYASGYTGGRLHGPGWSSTLDQRLEIGADEIHYLGDDAQILRYPHPSGPGSAVLPKEGARWPLTRDPDGTLRIEDPKLGWTRHFTPSSDPALWPLGALTDRNGHRVTFHRSGGAPTEVAHSAGYRVAVDTEATQAGPRIGALRLLDGTHDGRGTTLRRFDYDPRGRLVAIANSTGAPFQYTYDSADRITTWTDRNGFRYQYVYDDAGRVTHGNGPSGQLSATFEYHPWRHHTVVVDSLGARTEYHYDRRHHITRVVDPLGHSVLTEYDRHGRPLSYTDELGRTTRYTLDDHGDPGRIDRPDGTFIALRHNDLHLPTEVTGPDGSLWRYTYDGRGNLLSRVDPLGAVTTYSHDEQGRLTTVTDAFGSAHLVRNDAAGLPLTIVDALGNETRVARDAFGRIVEIEDPLGNRTRCAWTPEGLPVSRTYPDGSIERWHHDAQGNETAHENQNGAVSSTSYGPFGRAVSHTGPDGVRHDFAYDTELRLTAVTGPTGLVWRYERDAMGGLIGEVDFDGRRLGYVLDPAGQLVERVNSAGERITYRRDTLGRAVEVRHDAGAVTHSAYDANGLLIRTQNADAIVELTRDALGRVLTETVNGARLERRFDACGRLVRRTTPTGVVSTWAYDAAGHPLTLTTDGDRIVFAHDANGREVTRHLGTTAAITQTFDALDRLTAQSVWSRDASGATPLRQRTYAYRADGHLAATRDVQGGTAHYDLDAIGRVTAVQTDTWTEQYAYDALGNITHGRSPEADDSPAQGARRYAGTVVRSAGRTRYEHDAAGRLTQSSLTTLSGLNRHWHYTWDADDRLTQAATPDGTVWRYRYDPLGRRVAKQRLDDHGGVAEQTTFTWDDACLVEQVHSRPDARAESTTWDYQPGTYRPLTQLRRRLPMHADPRHPASVADREDTDRRFAAIVSDVVGTPTELVDADAQVTSLRGPGLWRAGDTADCPLRFPGQYHDAETGLHYNYLRYYDPRAGRYLSPDPLGLNAAPHPYTYVPNPSTWIDPLGLLANEPSDITWGGRVVYGGLDALLRPTSVHATLGQDMMGQNPTDPHVDPPGWVTGAGYNRAHLLGAQLGGSNWDKRNFVTMHAYANSPVMRHIENQVRRAVAAGEAIQYSVTPVYQGSNLIPKGVWVEAYGSNGFRFTEHRSTGNTALTNKAFIPNVPRGGGSTGGCTT